MVQYKKLNAEFIGILYNVRQRAILSNIRACKFPVEMQRSKIGGVSE